MKNFILKYKGFTLIEIAIVLVIVSVLLGYTFAMIPVQQDLKQYRKANQEMDEIIKAIYAFAQVNGRLPCADNIAAPDGVSDPDDGTNCTANIGWYGLLPAKTLGLEGSFNANGSLLDPWGTPYRYQVTSKDTGTGAGGDFVIVNDIRDVGMATLDPDLQVCTIQPSPDPDGTDCGLAPVTIIESTPAVVLSLGKDKGTVTSDIQVENTDNTADGSSDIIFVKATRNDTSGAEFDDVIKWISPNILYSKMIDAGKLP